MTSDQNSAERPPRPGTSRIGMLLFVVYFLFYAGFVLANAFVPSGMEWRAAGGLNVAVLYGFGLILGAIALSAVYGFLSRDTGSGDQGARS